MKKLGGLILGLIIGAAAMYYYCSMEQADDESMSPTAPKGLIKPAEIKTMTEAYNPRYDTITSVFFRGIDGGDNRSSWYSLEDLQSYLDYAENEAGELKYTMDGVRLYLGVKAAEGGNPGYTTLLFVPTGYPNTSKGSMFNFRQGGGDIPGGSGLDHGGNGIPPSGNYPL